MDARSRYDLLKQQSKLGLESDAVLQEIATEQTKKIYGRLWGLYSTWRKTEKWPALSDDVQILKASGVLGERRSIHAAGVGQETT